MLIVKYNTAKNVHNSTLFCFSALIEETKTNKTSEVLFTSQLCTKYFRLLELSGVGGILGFIQDAVSSVLLDQYEP